MHGLCTWTRATCNGLGLRVMGYMHGLCTQARATCDGLHAWARAICMG